MTTGLSRPELAQLGVSTLPAVQQTDPRMVAGRSGSRVLVVDGDPDQRDLLAIHLRRAGCRVTTAPTGEDALDLLDVDHFDLAILDVQLPGISGPAIGRILRHRQPACAIVLTSVLDPDDLPAGEQVLFKPFTRADVMRLIPARRPPAFIPLPRSGVDH